MHPHNQHKLQICLCSSPELNECVQANNQQIIRDNNNNIQILSVSSLFMHRQLRNMWDIQQQDNDSKTQQQIPTSMTQQTKLKLKLIKLGEDDPQQQEHTGQLDLDSYLQMQKANSKARMPRPKPKTAEQIQKQRQFKQGYGKGFKMLQKMGFNINKGLGKNEQGRTNIVQAQFKTSLTTRDQQYEQQEQRKRQEQKQAEQQKQLINPYNEYQFEQILQYRSKIPSLNRLLMSLKNKYETAKSKLDLIGKQTESFNRDLEISQSLKLQKKNEIKAIDEQILGLEMIQKSSSNIQKYPHLGLAYNADLLIIKETIDKLLPMDLQKLANALQPSIKKAVQTLSSLYLAKQRQSLKSYNQVSGIELKMKKLFQKNQGASTSKKSKFSTQHMNEQQIIQLSLSDLEKIKKYSRTIIEESVVANKLDTYFRQRSDIKQCEQYIIDLMEAIKNTSKQVCEQLKSKYLIPMANSYLINFKYQPNTKKLPHLVIVPWMMIIRKQQLEITKFINNMSSRLWPLETDELYNIIVPWYKHMSSVQQAYFANFYLAPRILYQMENFSLTSATVNQKQKIKGLIKYCELIPIHSREEIIENSLALTLLYYYQKQLSQGKQKKSDLNQWVLKWADRIDKICEGAIKKIFLENNVSGIW